LPNKFHVLLNTLVIVCLFYFSAGAVAAPQAHEDYDPATGEPRCIQCHNHEKKYSIDYTREPSCYECHGPGLSERYIAVNKKYRDYAGEGRFAGDAPDAVPAIVARADIKPSVKKTPRKSPIGQKAVKKKDMVYVPAGSFTMGSDDWWPKSQPEHKRFAKGFYIDKYEVTVERYAAFIKATGADAPLNWKDGKFPEEKAGHPVTYVSWSDADAFCRWEGKRLPREVQWEKAARGTDKRAFPWGERFSKKKANTPQLGFGNTMKVGSFPDGVSPYGVYDMAGNVWEWVDDWFKPYPGNTHPDENYGERFKVLRGGSWYDCTYYKCGISAPSYNRIFFNPDTRNNNFGFRCVAGG